MLWKRETRRVYAYAEAVDMRKSFDGLLGVTRQVHEADGLSGDMYVFVNRRRTLAKILCWDRTGWCVLAKRLERGRFELRQGEDKQELSQQELELLLDGVLTRRVKKSVQ